MRWLELGVIGMLAACGVGDDGESERDASTGLDASSTGMSESSSTGTTLEASSGGDESGTMSGCEDGPLPAPIPGCAPEPYPSTGDFHQDCVDRINQFRWECQCLPPLQRWSQSESCTDEQSAIDQSGGGLHGNVGYCEEFAQATCPNWGSTESVIGGCLQAMWDEGPGEPFSAHGHYLTMASLNYSAVACGFSSTDAGVWSNQNYR